MESEKKDLVYVKGVITKKKPNLIVATLERKRGEKKGREVRRYFLKKEEHKIAEQLKKDDPVIAILDTSSIEWNREVALIKIVVPVEAEFEEISSQVNKIIS